MDCLLCEGDSRQAGIDCAMCGGSGYAPPIRPADHHCADCKRGLWSSARGPKWYEHQATGRTLCRWCLAARTDTIRPKKTNRRSEEVVTPDALN